MMSQLQKQDIETLFTFNNDKLLNRALTHKTFSIEYSQKTNRELACGHNDDWSVLGHQLMEFLFIDYLCNNEYPKTNSPISKTSDMLQLRAILLSEKNLAELAGILRLKHLLKVGKQNDLNNQPKPLSECFKSIVAAHYYDKCFDMEQLRIIMFPIYSYLIEKNKKLANIKIQQSFKGQFYAEMDLHKSFIPEISLTLQRIMKNLKYTDQYTFVLKINDEVFTEKGENKRETEERLYQNYILNNKQPKLPNFLKTPIINNTEANEDIKYLSSSQIKKLQGAPTDDITMQELFDKLELN